MSFEIWVSAFKNEDHFWFPASELRRRFSKHIENDGHRGWRLTFNEGPSMARLHADDEGNSTTGFTVVRPPHYLDFWDIIGGILHDLPCVLYWPSVPHRAVMGSLDLLPHLPSDFVRIFGIPWVTTDGAKIRDYVEENS